MADSCLYTEVGEMAWMHMWKNNYNKTYPSGMQKISPYQKDTFKQEIWQIL